jgi:hypothetical protein
LAAQPARRHTLSGPASWAPPACEGPGLPDPIVDDLYESAIDEIGPKGLDRGWHLVAVKLRPSLIKHAEELGCDCGSSEWMIHEQLRHAGLEPDGGRSERSSSVDAPACDDPRATGGAGYARPDDP